MEEPKKQKKKGGLAISQLSRSARPQKRAKDQTQIERSDVNQQSLENVRVSSQMRPSSAELPPRLPVGSCLTDDLGGCTIVTIAPPDLDLVRREGAVHPLSMDIYRCEADETPRQRKPVRKHSCLCKRSGTFVGRLPVQFVIFDPDEVLAKHTAFTTLGNTHMANNGPIPNADLRVAIDMRGAGRAQIGSVFGPNIIKNNVNGGVSLQENAEISFWALTSSGPNIIRNNGPFGVKAGFGSQVTLAGDQISGHTGPGVDIYAHSQLYAASQLPGLTATQISNNGTAGNPLSAGIRVDGGSEALLRGVTISQNNGPAILALVNSSVDFAGSTFNGNAGVITCDSSSTMVSDLGITARTPAAGVSCTTAHTLGNRVVSVPTPAVPDLSVWKKLHSNYQQRSAAQK